MAYAPRRSQGPKSVSTVPYFDTSGACIISWGTHSTFFLHIKSLKFMHFGSVRPFIMPNRYTGSIIFFSYEVSNLQVTYLFFFLN